MHACNAFYIIDKTEMHTCHAFAILTRQQSGRRPYPAIQFIDA